MAELGIAIRTSCAFARLAVGLQAEVQLFQQFAHNGVANLVTALAQLAGKPPQAFGCPAQGRHGIAARIGVNEGVQIRQQLRRRRDQGFAAATGAANPSRLQCLRHRQIFQAAPNGAARHPRRTRNRNYAPVTGRFCFAGNK